MSGSRRSRWSVWFLPIFAIGSVYCSTPEFRVENFPVAGGAELLTVFGRLPDAGRSDESYVPLLSVLRDTLGDENPQNNRLRYVWVLTSARPSLLQRAAGSLPFFYWRPDSVRNADHRPVPVLDLGATSHVVWRSLAGQMTQVLALDPNGAIVRSSTRSYRNNLADHRRVHLLEGLAVLSELEDEPDVKNLLHEPELLEMETRLALAGQTLGGLVTADKLPTAYVKQRTRTEEMRGHNWELLRQRAEANGLYFEPFGDPGSSTHALLWIATEDLDNNRAFDGQFLGIADPFHDERLRRWTGYREVRDGKEMIPLAMYGLEYPKVPLLLADFRDSHAPKRREMIRHAATDTVSGVLGISKYGNWPFFAGSYAFNFIRVRHGAANDRSARLKAYAQVRAWLALDGSVSSGLRSELQKRLDMLGVNPMEESVASEVKIARRQYAALVKYAQDPQGLPARIENDRQAELTAYNHSIGARAGFRIAKVMTLGIYSHREKTEGTLQASLDIDRRKARQTQFLETVAKSGPQAEIVWNMDQVRQAIDDIAASPLPARSAQLVQRIMDQTQDEETRAVCQRALMSFDASAGLQ
ncbi:MAG TPA: hypothetical protein VKR43_07225 [Bryobacteraceae bacterium]|nr:hypothetical protein [Bryobacteraceae bacterium]